MSAQVDVQEAMREFADVLRLAGLVLDGLPDMDDRLHRVKADGDSRRERSGAYVGHLDGWPAGYVQNFRAGIRRNWRYSKGGIQLSERERRQLQAETKRRQEAREAERQRLHERMAGRLYRMIRAGGFRAAQEDHPYLVAKGLTAGPRPLMDRQGNLAIFAYDIAGKLWSMQRIAPDGEKRFLRDGRVNGLHHPMRSRGWKYFDERRPLVIAEGWATGETIVRLTGVTVVVAFSSWNLDTVAREFRVRYPQARIVIAGDNDHRKPLEIGPDGKPKKNAGREAALAAAEAVNGYALLPEFEPGDEGSDWNDRMHRYGADQVKAELLAGFQRAVRAST
ncbi:toprim domain-containing protein [Nevskia soli]|uniref:toprim domain-containing protein n=1 Tax=Nevskia soli TaxID=418856 RepID=UPI0004A719F2|nr:toprim domain-containing protein [Nevskia soli]